MTAKSHIYQRIGAVILATALIALCIAGCEADDRGSAINPEEITSYRDIPGMTDAGISALEELIKSRDSFTFGGLSSPSVFNKTDGHTGGYLPLFCERLSGIFGVDFRVQAFEWEDLYEGIENHTIDFTDAFNMSAGMANQYYHTPLVATNRLAVFTAADTDDIISEYELDGRTIGFYTGSFTEKTFREEFWYIDFESAGVGSAGEIAEKLSSGGIDAFICDMPDVFDFSEYDGIKKAHSFPKKNIPVTITTANSELQPLIDAITKYLMAGGKNEFDVMHDTGEDEYAAHIIWEKLSDEERGYIENLKATGTKIPYGATANRYPVAFFDSESEQFRGIAIDVLDKISTITGIGFYLNCDENTTWRELEGMLKTGEIALLSQLIPNEARQEYAIWPDAPYFSARYALLSHIEYPFLRIDQVPYVTVGFPAGTAEEAKFHAWFPDAAYYRAYPFMNDGLDALARGEIDLFFSLDYTMLYESNYRENPNQKINILFDEPVEPVPFGLYKDEELLCSIISKTQAIIDTDSIAKSWTSRIFDQSAKAAMERAAIMTYFMIALAVVLFALLLMYSRNRRLRKESEAQSKASQEAHFSMQALIDMAPVSIIITRRGDGRILYANKRGIDMFGYSSFDEEISGKRSIDFMPAIQPDGKSSAEVIRKLWHHDRSVGELAFYKKSGESFIARVVYCAIVHNGEEASLNVVEDMTAEREYQRALKNIAEKELEANQLKSRFLANMSHEIRTPMNAILGIAEILLQNMNLSEEAQEAVTQIHESGYMLLGIINDILDISKIEAGKLDITPAEYNFPNLIRETLKLNHARRLNKPIEFYLDIDPGVPVSMIGDELRLKQILSNIISNAYKYTDRGEIKMSVSAQPLTSSKHTGTEETGNDISIVFTVSDTGQGMTEEQLEQLFVEYMRFNEELNHATEGVGLGMSITKHLIERMDGKIDVKSKPGEGSVFTVTLPQKRAGELTCADISDEDLQNIKADNSGTVRAGRAPAEHMPYGRVLVVDDVKSNVYVTRGMLMPYGLQIDTASSGEEAIKKVDSGNEYDIIFMDHMMPKMNGIEATKILRERGYNNCIIALTANAIVGQAEMFIENGFDGYISKPIDSRELDHALKKFIGK